MHHIVKISLAATLFGSSLAFGATSVTLYKSPDCGCCGEYVEYLKKNGYTVNAINDNNMDAIKKQHGVSHVASCHTTLVNGYVVEGHVPVGAINKMLKDKPNIVGISAPGMPQNSPGMGEMIKGTLTIYGVPKNSKEPYVFSVE